MTGTRFNSHSESNYGVDGLSTGYEGPTPDLFIPSCGIEDVDRALFTLFDKEIPFQVITSDGDKPVPVIFSSGEKWALNKRTKALHDKMNTLILPLITIVRTSIDQDSMNDTTGRGINQQTGEIVVTRRLDRSDRSLQQLLNRLYLRTQTNIAVKPTDERVTGQLVTSREVGDLSLDPSILDGDLLLADRKLNVYETITIPAPRFFTAQYAVTMWAQHIQQMNQMIETLVNSMLPQAQMWKLETPKGYWFLAKMPDGKLEADTNFDSMGDKERTIKLNFTISVPAYMFASDVAGAPVPVKRYVSCPIVKFEMSPLDSETIDTTVVDNPFLGADDPTLPIDENKTQRRDQRRTGAGRVYPGPGVIDPHDPALTAYQRGLPPGKWKKVTGTGLDGKEFVRYVRVKSTNKRGEMVTSDITDFEGLTIVVTNR